MSIPIDEPGRVREGEELDLERLGRYLRERLDGLDGPLVVEQFPAGFSNLTYLVTCSGRELVLRRPPFGNQVRSAHDMGREHRVLSGLSAVYEAAPRPVLYCDDPEVIGDRFYLLERRRGVVLRSRTPPPALAGDPRAMERLSEAFIDNLAALHRLDYRAAGLGDLGHPEGYVERQVAGWRRRYEKARTADVPEMERLGEWLDDHRPGEAAAALIHNDYKFDNLLLDPEDLTRIVAVLDWEMATVGDPLMDLGTTLAYWVEERDPPERHESAFGPTMAPGALTRRGLIERYRERTGFDIPDPLFYFCYGLFKLAVIVQQIHARYVRGYTRDPRFATLDVMVAILGRAAIAAIDAGEV